VTGSKARPAVTAIALRHRCSGSHTPTPYASSIRFAERRVRVDWIPLSTGRRRRDAHRPSTAVVVGTAPPKPAFDVVPYSGQQGGGQRENQDGVEPLMASSHHVFLTSHGSRGQPVRQTRDAVSFPLSAISEKRQFRRRTKRALDGGERTVRRPGRRPDIVRARRFWRSTRRCASAEIMVTGIRRGL
jgi:hypothetical protein